jgi:putative ABC transport system permease protein
MRLALQNLFQDRLRLALSVLGVALAVMLILLLLGLRAGALNGAAAYLDNAPGSVIVMPQGIRSTSAGYAQVLPPEAARAVASTPGVAQVTRVLLTIAIPEWHGAQEAVRLIGYDSAVGGGPWKLTEGREPAAHTEVVIDRALAARHGFQVGDSFEFRGLELTVTGRSSETSSLLGAYIFARLSLVESLMLAPGAVSFVLVTPGPGVTAAEILTGLLAVQDTNVMLKADVAANNREIIANIFDPVIILMVSAAFVVGALVVGMVIYTATIERRSEYGVLKAIGASNGVIYRTVVWQALVAAGLGVVGGVGLAFALGWLVTALRPQFLVSIEPVAIALTLAAGAVMALLGALIPARLVARLAPADVFRR